MEVGARHRDRLQGAGLTGAGLGVWGDGRGRRGLLGGASVEKGSGASLPKHPRLGGPGVPHGRQRWVMLTACRASAGRSASIKPPAPARVPECVGWILPLLRRCRAGPREEATPAGGIVSSCKDLRALPAPSSTCGSEGVAPPGPDFQPQEANACCF